MRIGLFSDTYLPATNGISYVLKIMQTQLQKLGHEVYIFAPATNLRGVELEDNEYIIRFPAIEGLFFDEQLTSLFFPPRELKKINKMELDIIHFFTPGQIGLMGAYAAIRGNTPMISQYSTDMYRYAQEYQNMLPATIALSLSAPFILKIPPRDAAQALKVLKPQRDLTQWHQDLVKKIHVLLHDYCDEVIALSRKMYDQLESWGSKTPTTLLPTGVDPIPPTSQADIKAFREKYNIAATDIVYLYLGRLSREKNLDLLIDAFELTAARVPNSRLVFVGDFDYRQQLEEHARNTSGGEKIIFTGRIAHDKLGNVYGAADVFLFPSVTDTQGLVVHEAAGAKLPLILCDEDVSEVFIAEKTGLLASATDPKDFSEAMIQLACDGKLRAKLGAAGKLQAAQFSELGQMQKLEKLYQKCIDQHKKLSFAGGRW